MKKNLFLRLCLMMAVLLSLYSCRQDILQEQETYHNTSAFQLTSKRISLNKSKHKAKLLPELEKAEAEFKAKTKSSAFGKTVNYGNGVSIDTDDVIYIQNGPDYYTYTFKINRENAPADAPVENLVLSPLSDGSWKEELVTYNLTAQEKQTILSGGAVNLSGKVTKEILQCGTYSSGMMNKGSWDNCYLLTSSYYTTCSGGQHSHGEPAGELEDGNCPADVQSVLVVTANLVCSVSGGGYVGTGSNESGTTPGGYTPSAGGSTDPNNPNGSNGSNNPNQPCDGNGIPSQPQDPSSILENQPCNNGTPTLPNLGGGLSNPCERVLVENANAKGFLTRAKASAHLATIKTGINTATIEKGFSFGDDSSTEQVTSISVGSNGTSVPLISYSSNFTIKGAAHTHPIGGYFAPSTGDVYFFLKSNHENPSFKYYFTISPNNNEYLFTITNKAAFDSFTTQFPKSANLAADAGWARGTTIGDAFYNVEKQFLNMGKTDDEAFELATAFVLNKYNAGIALSKKDAAGDFKPIFVEEQTETIPNPIDPSYPPIQVTYYLQTSNCNLK